MINYGTSKKAQMPTQTKLDQVRHLNLPPGSYKNARMRLWGYSGTHTTPVHTHVNIITSNHIFGRSGNTSIKQTQANNRFDQLRS